MAFGVRDLKYQMDKRTPWVIHHFVGAVVDVKVDALGPFLPFCQHYPGSPKPLHEGIYRDPSHNLRFIQYTSNHVRDPYIISGIFLISGVFGIPEIVRGIPISFQVHSLIQGF